MSGQIVQRCDNCSNTVSVERASGMRSEPEKPWRTLLVTGIGTVELCDRCASRAYVLLTAPGLEVKS